MTRNAPTNATAIAIIPPERIEIATAAPVQIRLLSVSTTMLRSLRTRNWNTTMRLLSGGNSSSTASTTDEIRIVASEESDSVIARNARVTGIDSRARIETSAPRYSGSRFGSADAWRTTTRSIPSSPT